LTKRMRAQGGRKCAGGLTPNCSNDENAGNVPPNKNRTKKPICGISGNSGNQPMMMMNSGLIHFFYHFFI
jgi:hypothetical protein